MKAPLKITLMITFVLVIFLSCGQSARNEKNSMVYDYDEAAVVSEADEKPAIRSKDASGRMVKETAQPQEVPNFIATLAAQNINDGTRQLVRIANIRMKTKEVTTATYAIENIVLKNKGFILNSSIDNNRWSRSEIAVSKDSTMIISYNELTANMTLRVPKDLLDETLREIAPLAVEIDYRRLTAEDMTFDIFRNQLTEARMFKKSKRVSDAISTRTGKLSEAISAEEALDRVEEMADQTELAKFTIKDKIEFSTIHIQLYQNRFETRSFEKRVTNLDDYKPSIWHEVLDSLKNGWEGICSTIVFLLNLWPLFVIVIVGAIIYFRRKRKPKGE